MTQDDAAAARIEAGMRVPLLLPAFVLTLFLSAFLLFSVQPFFAKLVLPRLGGSPGVWSVAMVFFQGMLLAGYAYAHVLSTRLRLPAALAVHAAVMVVAMAFFLPLGVADGWQRPPQSGEAFWLLGLFGASVGVPFFAVAANGPLLQAWFAQSEHPHAADPYFLYGASNIGSFASLILYIVAIEPGLASAQQAWGWSAGFVILALLIVGCGALVWPGRARAAVLPDSGDAGFSPARPARWMLYGFVPSGLLVAVTAHVSTDVAAAPFLWVVPLALFLLTFVIAFRRNAPLGAGFLDRLVVPLGLAAIAAIYAQVLLPVWLSLAVHLVFFFVAALFAHTLLYAARPAASGLTAFYLWMSAGGVLGGIFASLLAPLIFDWVAEYLLLIVATLFLSPRIWRVPRRDLLAHGVVALLIAGAVYVLGSGGILVPTNASGLAAMILFTAFAAFLFSLVSGPVMVVALCMLVSAAFLHAASQGDLYAQRSFFGVVRVTDSSDGGYRVMMHGTTLHGAMRNGETGRPVPRTYYHESGAMAAAIGAMQERRGGAMNHVGAIGLGTGSAVCHRAEGERWTAFEIDPNVVRAALDASLFRFMPECGPDVPVILGDARLTLEGQPDGAFDLLLVDAFSSDSIPVHLMTREAIRLYMRKTAPDGLVVMHISNRYLELESVLKAAAAQEGLAILSARTGEGEPGAANGYVAASHVVVFAESPASFGSLSDDSRWKEPADRGTRAWTDDFSNIFTALLRQL